MRRMLPAPPHPPASQAGAWTRRFTSALIALVLAGCNTVPPAVEGALPAEALLLGEQHDDSSHQRLHLDTVRALSARGQLAALALEMAEQGDSTRGLARDADEAAVRQSLRWNEQAWPWAAYGPAVMAAVRAGVPVLGANLPRAQMRAAMGDTSLDNRLAQEALARQREAIRAGHCDLLPPTQIAPMARIQIARDRAMASTVLQSLQAGRTVVLVAGAAHVDQDLGVPRHLPAELRVRAIRWPQGPPARDYCAGLREQMQAPRGTPAAPAQP